MLAFLAGHHLMAGGEAGRVALTIATAKANMPIDRLFFAAILANVLVCLAVWLALGARSTTDKIMAVLLPVAAFVAAGFEHVVANMYVLPLGMMIQSWGPEGMVPLPMTDARAAVIGWGALAANLAVATLGNAIGGGALVGLVYWLVYLRRRRRS
jgi:formate/nitrite transporter FocA (FNT family)